MDKSLSKEFSDRLIRLLPTPPSDDGVHYFFTGGVVTAGHNVMVHVTVLDEDGVPVIGAQVVDQRRDGKAEIAFTDGNGRVSFLYGRGNAYTPPDRGAHSLCVASDAVKDDQGNLITFVPRSTRLNGLGQYLGMNEEYHIQFRAFRRAAPTQALGTIRGSVVNGANLPVNLVGHDVNVTGTAGDDGSFGFDSVPPGAYVLTVVGTGASGATTVLPGQQAFITLTLSGPAQPTGDLGALADQVARLNTLMAKIRHTIENAGF